MKLYFTEIYLASRKYWNTRFNDIHVPLAYEFALQLLLEHPEADEDVVVPAILMHDNGWKMVSEEQQTQAFGPNMTRQDLRRFHETEGARLASEIMTATDYDTAKRAEIIEIIDGHDSRLEALSLNDQLVKDADKLWRFTPTGLGIDHLRFERDLIEHARWTRDQIEDWFFTDSAKQLAHYAIAQTLSKQT